MTHIRKGTSIFKSQWVPIRKCIMLILMLQHSSIVYEKFKIILTSSPVTGHFYSMSCETNCKDQQVNVGCFILSSSRWKQSVCTPKSLQLVLIRKWVMFPCSSTESPRHCCVAPVMLLLGEGFQYHWLSGRPAQWSGFHCITADGSRKCWSSSKAGELSPESWTSRVWDIPGWIDSDCGMEEKELCEAGLPQSRDYCPADSKHAREQLDTDEASLAGRTQAEVTSSDKDHMCLF